MVQLHQRIRLPSHTHTLKLYISHSTTLLFVGVVLLVEQETHAHTHAIRCSQLARQPGRLQKPEVLPARAPRSRRRCRRRRRLHREGGGVLSSPACALCTALSLSPRVCVIHFGMCMSSFRAAQQQCSRIFMSSFFHLCERCTLKIRTQTQHTATYKKRGIHV